MSDTAGAAPAAPEPAPAPAAPSAPSTGSKPPASAREAVDNAFAEVGLDDAQPPRPVASTTKPVEKAEAKPRPTAEAKPAKVEAKPQAKPAEKTETKPVETRRTPTGQFAPANPPDGAAEANAGAGPESAPASSYPEPPKRFSEDARAAWNDAPEPVRAEIHRATKELEQGIQKYRADAEEFEKVRPFHDLAQRTGTTLPEAMSKYVAIEQKLRNDFVGGLEELCRNRGITLRGLAERILQQPPNEQNARQDQVVSGLHREIAELKQQIGGISKGIETQRTEATVSEVQAFATEAGHERFEDLADDITFFLKTGRANDLAEAYELASRLNPGQGPSPAQPAQAPNATPAAQTRKGTLSVNGAPSSGSDPATRKPPKNARSAVDDAFAQLGIG